MSINELDPLKSQGGTADEVNNTVDNLAVDYTKLRYIPLRGDGSKLPKEKWGGYSQDYTDTDTIYTHDEIVEHDTDEWGVVGLPDYQGKPASLLIFDLDLYEADADDISVEGPENTLVVESQNGGLHVYFIVPYERGSWSVSDFDTVDSPFGIDIRGSAVSHHVVAPADVPGVDTDYHIRIDEQIREVSGPEEASSLIRVNGEQVITFDPGVDVNGVDVDYDGVDDDEWLLPDDVESALETVEATLSYESWRNIGFAIADYYRRIDVIDDAHDAALSTFIEWSKTGDNWDDDAERLATRIIDSAFEKDAEQLRDRAVTVGTLIREAQRNGWELPDVSERRAYRTVRSFIAEYGQVAGRPEEPKEDREDAQDAWSDYDDAWPDTDTLDDVLDALARVSDEHYSDVIDDVEERIGRGGRSDIDNERELRQKLQDTMGNVVSHDGELVMVHTDTDVFVHEATTILLNFELNVKSRLSVEGEGRRASVHVSPSAPSDPDYDVQFSPKVFNDPRRFKDEVMSDEFSTIIETDMSDRDVMDILRKYVSWQDVPDLVGQKQMGLSDSGDEFVTPNGTINADGWAEEPETVHVERGTGAETKFVANPGDHCVDDIDDDDVADIIELFTNTRDPERFLGVLGWFYAAPFRPWIVDRTGDFNLLHVNGDSGVGKTATLVAASKMFGMSNEPFSCADTAFATISTLSSSRGVPLLMDEYKTSELPDWQLNKLHELVRKAATGGVEQRGRPDQTTEEYHLRAPVVLAGETAVRGSAVQRRAIDTTFRPGPAESWKEEKRNFKALLGDATVDENGNIEFPEANYDLHEHGVEYYRFVTQQSDEDVEDMWYSAREHASVKLAEWDVDLTELEVQGLQTVVFGYRMMRSFAIVMGADLSELPGEDALNDALRYLADVDGDGRETHMDQFTGLVQRATVAGYLEEGTHYKVVREGKADEELRVNVSRAFDAVSKYVSDHDLTEDLLGSSKDYKSRYSEAVEEDDSYVVTTSQNTPPISRAVGIRTSIAEQQLSGFDRTVFVNEDDAGRREREHTDGDDDGDGGDGNKLQKQATPLKSISAMTGGYATVTAEVVNYDATPDEVVSAGGPAVSGSLQDSTGRVKVVGYDDADNPGGALLEPGETVVLRDVPVEEYKHTPQLVIDEGTKIDTIQQGVGYTEGQATSDGQGDLAAATNGGGSEDDSLVMNERREQVYQTIKSADDGVTVDELVGAVDASEDRVEHDVLKLKEQRRVYEPSEGVLRAT